MKKKIILFDFDGVIADSFDVAFDVNKIIDRNIVTENDFRQLFDGNIYDHMKNGGLVGRKEAEKMSKEFFKIYLPRMKEVKMVSGMKEAIKMLSKIYTLLIISSTITSPIGEFLKRYNTFSYFDEIVKGDAYHTNKVERIKMVFKKYKVGAKDCIFITDTLGDMKEAASVGVSSIGVAWGFQEKENLLKGNPFRIAEKPEDLCVAVASYFSS